MRCLKGRPVCHMPFRLLDIEGVADYLHLTPADIEHRVKNREIPFEKRGERIVFRKRDIEEWASPRILNLPGQWLSEYHGKSTQHTRRTFSNDVLIANMVEAGAIEAEMASKTRTSVLADLVVIAEKTGHLSAPEELLEGLKSREELCSTALAGGFALPHPRFHDSYRFDASFVVVGRTVQGIHFGAHDGEPTRLFFLICCQDERLHLHALARLCVMAKKTGIVEDLLEAPDAESMKTLLTRAEQAILNDVNAG